MLTIPNYQTSTQIYESANSLVYRATRNEDKKPVILKVLKEDYPTPEELFRYKQEYDLICRLADIDGVINAYQIEKYHNTLVICLEDFGGESLKHWLAQRTFSLEELLRLAILSADILGQVHQQNIIHKDINPANLIFNPTTGQMKIIDFGISSVLPRENLTLKNPNQLEGTLTYISPEQTGRMNRAVDYRTDFYSLGVTFYELFTSTVPFETTDAMELVHSHIAIKPPSPVEINPELPTTVSDIIMKLLEKTAEARYQSAWGLKADLQKCQANLAQGQFESFTLGQQDFSDQFQLPQKLYGREAEIEALLTAFERVSTPSAAEKGGAEMMLVAGYSGIGKSALVQEIYRPITEKHGYFISGKFDQLQRNIPYSAIVSAFRDLVRQLLSETEAQLIDWKTNIFSAVGNNGQVIIDVIPEVELIVGTTSPVPTLGPTETQNRFNLVFQNFIKVFTQPEHPLVIFLDDLQWADSASLKLIQVLMTAADKQALFLIGAYRDNEVSATHPLMLTLEEIQNAQAVVNQIFLSPLKLPHVTQLIADALHCSKERASPLSELVLTKTEGNPFFLSEFLKSLYVEGLLKFEVEKAGWQWDLPSIQARGFTDNVVELMIGNIQQLPTGTQERLQLASCIGNRFDLTTLAMVAKQQPYETALQLQKAVINGQLSILDSQPPIEQKWVAENELLRTSYRFTHDRIQQAAYSVIPKTQKQQVHLQIGQLLLQNTPPQAREQTIFAIVDQLNAGIPLIVQPASREELAQLNLLAGKKAKASVAYQPAYDYLTIGIELLDQQPWDTQYELTLALYIEIVEVAYLSAHLEQMTQFTEMVLQQAKTVLDVVNVYEIQLQARMVQNQPKDALKSGLTVLKLLGIEFPENPSQDDFMRGLQETQIALEGKQIEALAELPLMTDKSQQASVRILTKLISVTYQTAPNLFPLVLFKEIQLLLKHGNTPESAIVYSSYGALCAILGDIESGYQFAQLALSLLERLNAIASTTQVYVSIFAVSMPWKVPLKETLKFFQEGYQTGLETGDLEYGAYCAMYYCAYSYFAGQELTLLSREMANYSEALSQLKQQNSLNFHNIARQAVLNLSVESASPFQLIGEAYNEFIMRPHHQQINDIHGLFQLHFHKMLLCYLWQNHAEGLENANLAEQYIEGVAGILPGYIFYFYDSLIRLAVHSDSPSSEEQERILKKVADNQEKLANWAKQAPMNYQHKFYLVEAERCRVLGQDGEAREYYDKAIALAQQHEYVNEEALAHELAGRFYLAKGQTKFAQVCLREAHYAYQQWGAAAKVADLEQKYPQFLKPISTPVQTTITKTPAATLMGSTSLTSYSSLLDITSVVKASQTLSGEIVLERLLRKMMHLVIENAGAEKGFLLLPQKEQWFVEAEGHVGSEDINVLQSISVEEHQHLAASIVQYVARTQEHMVLDNASLEGQFARDPYLAKHRPKSVLCAPLINQGQLTGLLYLENNLTESAFTPERLEVLQVLSSQIAISIENALLYRTLEQKVEERTAQLAQANTQLADANQQIMALNEQLKSENLRMSAELEVSRQLQQMLLPQPAELSQIKALDIAGFMEPADEVGGDYYDVLQHNGRILFGIGDVTGHGLESGVLAIMVQAVVRALLCNNETDPVKFLSALNQTVYSNVQRMESEKNLTFALLEYQDNAVHLSGQHEEMIVVRQGQVECIDTDELGFPIGLEEDIGAFVAQEKVTLDAGDVVVLYTDGITEAENLDKEQYGLERLCEAVKQNWQCSAQDIRQAVISDVRQYIGEQKVFDDITLLVLKHH
jgi:predicted ATPase/serine phosphatase RsbU (regulator of sigma subunit)/tRNA A-37 threonylcarbamoyl transferase component Bud32